MKFANEQYVPSLSRAWNKATKKRLKAQERRRARRQIRESTT